jgi:serine/threonine protein kinase
MVIRAVASWHARSISHRDLKPENVLMHVTNEKCTLKITDFGLACRTSGMMMQQCGTPAYMSPQMADRRPYTKSTDMFSIGVLVCYMVTGVNPFYRAGDREGDDDVLLERIRRGDWVLHGPRAASLSAEARDFVGKLLQVREECRLTADGALAHPWLRVGRAHVPLRRSQSTSRDTRRRVSERHSDMHRQARAQRGALH